jgi:arylsulfatase A-like enzyme
VRLPFIARWPGKVPANRTDDTTVLCGIDLLPTLATVAHAPLPRGARLDGEDRSKALFGTPLKERARPLFWEYGRNDEFFKYPKAADRSPNLAIRDGTWKLLVNADGTGVELYDLSADPREARNVAADHPDVADRLRAAVLAWRKSLP